MFQWWGIGTKSSTHAQGTVLLKELQQQILEPCA
jgi:hypothetical protein